jgi:hypothetical protein
MGCPLNDFIKEGEIRKRVNGSCPDYGECDYGQPPEKTAFRGISVGIFKQIYGVKEPSSNRVISYRPARLHRLAE